MSASSNISAVFKENRLAHWSLRILYVLIFVAVFGDFIANEKPLWCKVENTHYFPVLQEYIVDAGWSEWASPFKMASWKKINYDAVIWAPIPYGSTELDLFNSGYVSPFAEQDVESLRWRHWCGTNVIGQDVLSGLISGTRIALLVGLLSMLLASIIGLGLGSVAGYFGNTGLQVSRWRFWLNIIAIFPAIFYGFISRRYTLSESEATLWEIMVSLFIIAFIYAIVNGVAWLIEQKSTHLKQITLPIDDVVMRLIEVMNSIPGLLLLLSLVAIFKEKSIYTIAIIIGLIGWTGIARFVRAELLRIRNLEYMQAAKALGYSDRRILWKHALPNALSPVLIAISFGIAGAILLEAVLAFLGIGAPDDQISWGLLLSKARIQFSAWWLAVFPGMAIFITVTIFNLLGDALSEKRRK